MPAETPPRRKPWNKWAVFGVVVGAVAVIGGVTGVINSLNAPGPSPSPSASPSATVTSPAASESPPPSPSPSP